MARILDGSEVRALVRSPTTVSHAHRFAFVQPESAAARTLLPLLQASRVEVVELADFEDPALSVRTDDLAVFIGGPLPPAHVFDPEHFSANDLCFFASPLSRMPAAESGL